MKGDSEAESALKSMAKEDLKRLQEIPGPLEPDINDDFRSSFASVPIESSGHANEGGDSMSELSSLSKLRKQIEKLEIRRTELDLTISALTSSISEYSMKLRKRQEGSIAQMSKLKLQIRYCHRA